jgi:hypothetical protein
MDGFLLQCEIVPKERGFKNILGHSSTLLNESYLKVVCLVITAVLPPLSSNLL